MQIRGKIGTMPSDSYKVKRKRKAPTVGQQIEVAVYRKWLTRQRHAPWQTVIVTDIIGDMYFMALS